MSKILLIVAIVLSVATAGIGFLNKQKLGTVRSEKEATLSSLASTQKQLKDAQGNLKKTEDQLSTASEEKDKALADASRYKGDLDQMTAKAADLETSSKANEGKVGELTEIVAERDKTIEDLLQKGGGGEKPGQPGLAAENEELKAAVASLKQKLDESSSKVNVLQQKEQERMAGRVREGLQGRVLAVNGAWNFVVLSIGDRNGVVNNSEMLVKRGAQYIGRVRVTAVEPSTSIADIMANSVQPGFAVQPGDQVIYQSSKD